MAKILIHSHDNVGSVMAGPGMRYWELSKALSRTHTVLLSTPNHSDFAPREFTIATHGSAETKSFIKSADIVIGQDLTPGLIYRCKVSGTRIIYDAYDPVLFEDLEIFKQNSPGFRSRKTRRALAQILLRFKAADAVICASERQRNLWIGVLMSLNKLSTAAYDADETLYNLVSIVPFGVADEPPVANGPGPREKFHLGPEDKVLLWGGGIWNWFDPLSLISAMKLVGEQRGDVKLVFLGSGHPSLGEFGSQMADKAKDLAKRLGLIDRSVFFNDVWVPYDQRQNYLLQAYIGVSTHFAHVETQFSFRTRILDYFWVNLPVIATRGDTLADLIESRQLGMTVPANSPQAIAEAILACLGDEAKLAEFRANIESTKLEYQWSNIAKALNKLIDQRLTVKAQPLNVTLIMAVARFYRARLAIAVGDKLLKLK